MKVLVTGAGGFVGQNVCAQLHAAGHDMRVLVRNGQTPAVRQLAQQFGAEVVEGDVLALVPLVRAATGTDAIIHLVGIIREFRQNTFESVHARGTQHIMIAAQEAKITRLLHMSSLGTRPQARSRYHQSKWAAETSVRQSGLNYTIFRPSIIYGPQDQFVNLFAQMIRSSPVLPVLGPGTNRVQPVAVQVVAQAFVRALTVPEAAGKTYDLAGPEVFTLNALLDQMLAVMQRRRFKVHLPMFLARQQARMLEWIFPKILCRPAPLNRDQLLMLEEDNVGNPAPADAELGLRHPSFQEGIRSYLR